MERGARRHLRRAMVGPGDKLAVCDETPRRPKEVPIYEHRGRLLSSNVKGAGDFRDDAALCGLRARCLERLAADQQPLVIDLVQVQHLDSRLVATLVDIVRSANRAGVDTWVRLSPSVAAWLEVCQVCDLLASHTVNLQARNKGSYEGG